MVEVIKPYKVYTRSSLNQPALVEVTGENPPVDETITRYGYDLAGNLIRQTDANQSGVTPVEDQKHTRYEYDQLGRRTKRVLPQDQEETWVYDTIEGEDLVQRITHLDFNGTVTIHDHDEMGRITTIIPSSPVLLAAGLVPVEFTYTATGQRETMTDASGLTVYDYDEYNRLWRKTVQSGSPEARTLTYEYDANGNIESITSSTGHTALTYDYDDLNRLVTAGSAAGTTAYNYDEAGNLETVTHPNLAVTTYNYNDVHRLTDVTLARGGTLASFNYNPADRLIGPAGNRRAVRETIHVNGTTAIQRNVDYDYDRLYRLTKEDIVVPAGNTAPGVPAGSITYGPTAGYAGYDKVGNRRSRAVSSQALIDKGVTDFANHTFDANDRLFSGSFAYEYDDNGNTRVGELPGMTGAIAPSPAAKDEYDFQNRLIRRSDGNTTITLFYDGDGNRVKKIMDAPGTANDVATFYLVDDRNPTGYAQVLEEWKSVAGGPSTLDRSYAYGHDLICQRNAQATTHFYGYDGHSSVRVLLDANGTITDAYSYDAFGIVVHQWHQGTPTPNNYLFAGEYWDPHLGLHYNRARYLNPNTGRFWTMDGFEGFESDPFSLHKYLYAADNPVNNIDPSGNMAITVNFFFDFTFTMNLRARWEKARGPFYTAATVGAIAVAGIAAYSAVTEWLQMEDAHARLAEAGTSVRNEIAKAEQILRTSIGNIRIPKIVPMPMSIIPDVAKNVAVGQLSFPGPLTRANLLTTARNRYLATRGKGSAGLGMSWDEYPFASTIQGGRFAVVRPVPEEQNWIQGGIIAAAYMIENINVGDHFVVVITP